jgi:hypothetical protein
MIHGIFAATNYTGESCQLPDCEYDAMMAAGWFGDVLTFGREVIGSNATRKGFMKTYRELAAKKKPDDLAIVTWSGHGTTDVINGVPVQGLVLADLEILYEFELRKMFADLSNVLFIADCCFAGGLPRSYKTATLKTIRRERWIPSSYCFHRRDMPLPGRVRKKPRVRIMACQAGETAASTGQGGALTLALDEAFQKKQLDTPLLAWGRQVQHLLPNEKYDQHPQVNYVDRTFANRAFKSFARKWNRKPA